MYLTFFIGCVLYHYGLTEFKVNHHKHLLTFADAFIFKYYTVIFGVSRGKHKNNYIFTHIHVLTRNTLALGALTQLVWARGTIIVIIILFRISQVLRVSTALGLPLERPKCKFRINERPVKTPRY